MFTLIMLISHTVADFLLQSDKIAKLKNELKIKGYICHAMGLAFTSLPFILLVKYEYMLNVAIIVLVITASHIALDYLKEIYHKRLVKKKKEKNNELILFVMDQVLHIAIILFLTRGMHSEFNSVNLFMATKLFANGGMGYSSIKAVFVILYVSLSGIYFVPMVFDIIYKKVKNRNKVLNEILKENIEKNAHAFIDEVNAGKWIGVLERILILTLLFMNEFAAIGFVIAAKSVARFKMMDNKIFAEYYLLGTMLSVVYTIVCYGIFQMIL